MFWPGGWRPAATLAGLDPLALAIAVAAMVALFRFKVGVIPVILACGAAGLVSALVR